MAGCCDPHGYDQVFGEGFARRMARRYRKRGLDRTANRLVDFLAADGLAGATVLEIGGGVGEVGLELLKRGAATVTNVELVASYDEAARGLAEAAGVADRVHRRILDIATAPDQVAKADVVVLHRVVCCYPDFERLLGAAADRCGSRLAFSHPPGNLVSRAVFAAQNAALRVARRDFRAFAHPPAAMLEVLTRRGLRPVMHEGTIWEAEGLVRTA